MTKETLEKANALVKEIESLDALAGQMGSCVTICYGSVTKIFYENTVMDILKALDKIKESREEELENL